MLEVYDAILIGAIAGLSGAIGILIAAKWMLKTEKIIEMVLDLTNQLQTYEDFLRFLHIIGGMIANGAKKGIGLPSPKGKGGLQDIVLSLFGSWFSAPQNPQTNIGTSGISSNRPPPDIR